METNRIEPVVDQSFKLGEIPDALRFMKEGRHFGKIAIAIGD
jgi:NADPH:quinone reductase-like Zn-dependent oxidoreductase